MTRIQIIGNSSDSRNLYEFIQKIVSDNKYNAEVRWQDVPSSTASKDYGIAKFPGLIIDGRKISEGRIYRENDIENLKRLIR